MIWHHIITVPTLKVLTGEDCQGSKIGSNDKYSFGDGVLGIFFFFTFQGTLLWILLKTFSPLVKPEI
jgi:hypothetical protein